MKNIICAIMSEMSCKQEFYRESTRGLGLALMMMIARMNSNVGNAPEGLRQKNGFDQVRPALEHIRDHYAMPMKIAEIASVCHMSESHFRRLFEENIGMTPVDYLNQVRVKKACDMIRKTGYSMEEIAVKWDLRRPLRLTVILNGSWELLLTSGRNHRKILRYVWQILIF